MKLTLTALTAAIFASALAIPAFAQVGVAGDGSVNSPSTSTSSSTSTEYRSERTDETAPVAPPMEENRRVEHKTVTRSTTEAVPPPVVEESTTTRRSERERDREHSDHGVGAHVGANVGPVGAHVGAGVGSKDAGY
jgi:hypothetical protein